MQFCFHFSKRFDDKETNLLVSNIEQNLVGKFTFSHSSSTEETERACVFIDAFVEFPRDYLLRLAIELSDPQISIAYSDFVWMAKNSRAPKPALLPDWSPERYLAIDYLGPVMVVVESRINTSLDILELDRTQIVLAAIGSGSKIARVKDLQYMQRSDQHFESSDTREKQISQFLAKYRNDAQVVLSSQQVQHIVYSNQAESSVSIVIPTRGSNLKTSEVPMIVSCVESLIGQEIAKLRVQIVIVFDTDTDTSYMETIKQLIENSNFTLLSIPYSAPFNFSSKCNLGALASNGEVLIFLNDDTLCISKNVITELVALSQISDVGAVGAKLLFQEGLVQHGGYIIRKKTVSHAYIREADAPRANGDLLVTHEVAGVTGACLAQRREVYEAVGMWDESLPSSYNDVDFCFRVSSRGYRILQANNVVLNHFESITRNPHVSKSDRRHIDERWPTYLANERFFRSLVQIDPAKLTSKKGVIAYGKYGLKILKEQGIRGVLLLVINVASKSLALLEKLVRKDV